VQTTPERISGARNNVRGVEAEMRAAQGETDVTGLGRSFPLDGRPGAVDVDVVSNGGRRWVEVKNTRPFGLESSDWLGNPSAGQQGLRTQAAELLRAASQNPLGGPGGPTPEVVVQFPRGVTPEVAAALEAMGVGVEGPRVAFSGGAGLLSTARDYGRFLQMMLNGGELDGVRVLSPKTVELMTVNHVGSLFAERGPADAGKGFGLGFDVVEDLGKTGSYGTLGAFGWGGAYHTNYWVDPKEKLVAVIMTQLLPSGGSDLHGRFRTLVYQSIVGPPTGVPAAAKR